MQEDTLLNQVLLLDSIDAIAIGSIGVTSIMATEDCFLNFTYCKIVEGGGHILLLILDLIDKVRQVWVCSPAIDQA